MGKYSFEGLIKKIPSEELAKIVSSISGKKIKNQK